MTALAPTRRPTALAILLIIGGLLGLLAAFELTYDKFELLLNKDFVPTCYLNPIYQCTKNLNSPEGAVFGFPNSFIGLMAFPAPIFVGVSLLAGARFPRWFWALFNLGMAFAIGFVMWLISVSLFHLGTLCPWCMVVWRVVIPMSIAVTLYNLREGNLPLGRIGRRVGSRLYEWIPLITLLVYVVIVALAQVELRALNRIF